MRKKSCLSGASGDVIGGGDFVVWPPGVEKWGHWGLVEKGQLRSVRRVVQGDYDPYSIGANNSPKSGNPF